MKQIIFIIALTPFLTVSLAQESKFKINGLAKDFSDNTVLYLDYIDEKRVDSTLVKNENFTFDGELNVKVVRAILRTKDYSDYKFIWLENSVISFKGEKGKFRKATIEGSTTQKLADELNTAIEKAGEEKEKQVNISFIESHPNSIISGHLLSVYGTTWGKQTTENLFNNLSTEIKNTSYGKSVQEFISLNKDLKIGDKYVDFSQPDTQQRIVKLSDFHGKVILLEFWGSWCGPCRKANPELVKIYNEFKDKGFEILGVGAELNRELWLKAIEKDKLSWPNVSDIKGDKNEAALIYGVSYYPTNFLIDKNGIIISRDLKGDKLRDKLKEILTY